MATFPAILDEAPLDFQAWRRVEGEFGVAWEVLRVWPAPSCLRWEAGGWVERPVRLHVRLADAEPDLSERYGLVFDEDEWSEPLMLLFSRIPGPVRAALGSLDDEACWSTLRLLSDAPALLELALAAPILAALLAWQVDAAEDREAAVRALAGVPRERLRDVPLRLGLPAGRTTLRRLARVDPWALSVPGPEAVLGLLRDPPPGTGKWLRHLPRITPAAVLTLRSPSLLNLCTFDLLAEADPFLVVGLHSHLREVWRARALGQAPRTPARFKSSRELWEFCRELPARRERMWKPAAYPGQFDLPASGTTLAGDPPLRVLPVETAAELRDLGLAQQLCIPDDPTYPNLATLGGGAIYRVTWPAGGRSVEATLSLCLDADGAWVISELALKANAAPPVWLRPRLRAWIDGWPQASGPGEPAQQPDVGPWQLPLPLSLSASPADERPATLPPGAEPLEGVWYGDEWLRR